MAKKEIDASRRRRQGGEILLASLVETNNVFVSWSGARSKAAAEALRDWLPTIIQAARPWMSATDVEKGTRWREEITRALDAMKAGIICLTPENLTAEWLLFEAGALSKAARDPQTRIWTYLLADLKPQDVKEPLAMFQATAAEQEDTRKLIHAINKNLEARIEENRLNFLFDRLWPDLEQKLEAIPAPSSAAPAKRSSDEIAAESLELLRTLAPQIQEISSETRRRRLMEEQIGYYPTYAERPSVSGGGFARLSSLLGAGPETSSGTDNPRSTSVFARAARRVQAEAKAKKKDE